MRLHLPVVLSTMCMRLLRVSCFLSVQAPEKWGMSSEHHQCESLGAGGRDGGGGATCRTIYRLLCCMAHWS